MNKGEKFNQLLVGLRYNYPSYVSTFGTCCNKGCNKIARGSGRCAECITDEIGALINDKDLAEKLHRLTKESCRIVADIRDILDRAREL